jgi:pimeloyl-ACP methyl ester carboxylesterase
LVALQYAAEHTELVAGLLLVDPAGDARQVPPEQMESLMAGLDSEVYAETIEGYWRLLLSGSVPEVQERVLADLDATPNETVVGFFRAQMEYDPLSALRRYGGPKLSDITPVNDALFGLHNLVGADFPHTTFTGTGH